jgi:hypothetical protein
MSSEYFTSITSTGTSIGEQNNRTADGNYYQDWGIGLKMTFPQGKGSVVTPPEDDYCEFDFNVSISDDTSYSVIETISIKITWGEEAVAP